MKENEKDMTCAAFQEQLPELIGTGAKISNHPHVQSCDLCRALLADLETIAEAARQLFPVVDPPDDMWEKFESKLKEEAANGSDADPVSKPKPN